MRDANSVAVYDSGPSVRDTSNDALNPRSASTGWRTSRRVRPAASVSSVIGVVPKKQGGGYTLLYDFWGPGQRLKSHFGDGLTKLKQMYGVHKATAAARAKGYMVTRKPQASGAIKLVVTGV